MGWLSSSNWSTKKEMVQYLLDETSNHNIGTKDGVVIWKATVLGSSLRGNTLYSAKAIYEREDVNSPWVEKDKFIEVDLISYFKRDYGYGFKDMTEDMGPYEIDCPLYFFDLVPVPDSECAVQWRKNVREHHASKKVVKRVSHGDVLKFTKPMTFGSFGTFDTFYTEKLSGSRALRFYPIVETPDKWYVNNYYKCRISQINAREHVVIAGSEAKKWLEEKNITISRSLQPVEW